MSIEARIASNNPTKMIMNTIISLCIANLFYACSEPIQKNTVIKVQEGDKGFVDATYRPIKKIVQDSISKYMEHIEFSTEEEEKATKRAAENFMANLKDTSERDFDHNVRINDSIVVPRAIIEKHAQKALTQILEAQLKINEITKAERENEEKVQNNQLRKTRDRYDSLDREHNHTTDQIKRIKNAQTSLKNILNNQKKARNDTLGKK